MIYIRFLINILSNSFSDTISYLEQRFYLNCPEVHTDLYWKIANLIYLYNSLL